MSSTVCPTCLRITASYPASTARRATAAAISVLGPGPNSSPGCRVTSGTRCPGTHRSHLVERPLGTTLASQHGNVDVLQQRTRRVRLDAEARPALGVITGDHFVAVAHQSMFEGGGDPGADSITSTSMSSVELHEAGSSRVQSHIYGACRDDQVDAVEPGSAVRSSETALSIVTSRRSPERRSLTSTSAVGKPAADDDDRRARRSARHR